MTEKTEEQIAKEKTAVDAMRNARGNMDAAIRRIETLEFGLKQAVDALKRAKGLISASVYIYGTDGRGGQVSAHAAIEGDIASAQAKLG